MPTEIDVAEVMEASLAPMGDAVGNPPAPGTVMGFEVKRASGIPIVLSAPSGGGKSTITHALVTTDPGLRYSISCTTRPRRADERHGEHYFFMTEEEFTLMIARGEFYEYARVHGNLYGTRRSWVSEQLGKVRDVVLDIDVQGGLNLKRLLPVALLVFILPPSMEVLENRLRTRGTDDDATIRRRLDNARREIDVAGRYDYVVVNDDLQETIARIRRVIEVERLRSARSAILADGQPVKD